MAVAESVIVELEARVAGYNRDINAAAANTDRRLTAIEAAGHRMGRGLRSAFSIASTAATGFAAAAVATGLFTAVKAGLEYASSLGEVAQQLGVTTDALQEYRYAASQAGLSVQEIDQALGQLTRRVGEAADGSKAQSEAFDELGISINALGGGIKSTGDLIPEIAEALSKIESPAQRARLEMDLFGRAGQKLEPLLAGGAAGVNALRDAAHRLGIVLSEEQIRNADDTADKLAAVKQVLEANIAGAVANNSQAILGLADAFTRVVIGAGRAIEAIRRFNEQVQLKNEQRILENTANGGAFGLSYTAAQRRDARRRVVSLQGQQFFGRSQDPTPSAPQIGGSAGGSGGESSGSSGRGGGGGSSGPSREELARRAAQAEAQFQDEMGRLRVESLRLLADLNGSARARREAELAQIEEDRASFGRQLQLDEDLTAARRTELLAARDAADFQRRAIAEQEANIRRAEDSAKLELAGIEAERELADYQAELADSASARLDSAYRLIDLAQRAERAELERILAVEQTGSVEAEIAQARLAELDAAKSRSRNLAARNNQTPAQAFMSELSRSREAINDDIEAIAVDGLESLNDGITDAITGAKSLGDAFKGVANQIIADLIRIAVQQAIIKPLAENLFGGSGGGGGFDFSSFASIFGGGKAIGGPISPGQVYKVGENGPEYISTNRPSFVTPNTQLPRIGGALGMNGGTSTIRLELSGDLDAKIMSRSAEVAIEVVKIVRPGIVDEAARTTLLAAQRPTLG